jgi:hypothetical protein
MEINKYTDITGVVTLQQIVEGRMVLLISNAEGGADVSYDFGSRVDLPGARLPQSQAEAAKAHYVITFAVDNSTPPLYNPYPSFSYALRSGFDQSSNVPFDAEVHMTQQSMREGLTIPSGIPALAFGPGVFTVPSGAFIYSANLQVPGTWLEVANTAEDGAALAGMLMEDADGSEGKFAQVERFSVADWALTFRINW